MGHHIGLLDVSFTSVGDASGSGANNSNLDPKAHLAGAVQEPSERPELQRDPPASADGTDAPGRDSGCAGAVS